MVIFDNATEAFEHFYKIIVGHGEIHGDTKAIFNAGFLILYPMENIITTDFRNFKESYAKEEWKWYLSGDPNAEEISKIAPIWKKHMDKNGNVQSNYGWQWKRKFQLYNIIEKLKKNKEDRQCVLSIYDGKEITNYKHDTPCTLAIQFQHYQGTLNMTVMMRSCDLWYGFCNDQYQFSKLFKLVCDKTKYKMGTYFHFCTNLHLYNNKLNKDG